MYLPADKIIAEFLVETRNNVHSVFPKICILSERGLMESLLNKFSELPAGETRIPEVVSVLRHWVHCGTLLVIQEDPDVLFQIQRWEVIERIANYKLKK